MGHNRNAADLHAPGVCMKDQDSRHLFIVLVQYSTIKAGW